MVLGWTVAVAIAVLSVKSSYQRSSYCRVLEAKSEIPDAMEVEYIGLRQSLPRSRGKRYEARLAKADEVIRKAAALARRKDARLGLGGKDTDNVTASPLRAGLVKDGAASIMHKGT